MSEVRVHLVKLNDFLSRYTAIHDDFFSSSIRRMIPIPGIFKPIDFARHEHELTTIGEDIGKTAHFFEGLPDDNADAREALEVVRNYTRALHDAVTRLRDMASRLRAKADGIPYATRDYNADLAEYKVAAARYYSLGDEMNAAFSILRIRFP